MDSQFSICFAMLSEGFNQLNSEALSTQCSKFSLSRVQKTASKHHPFQNTATLQVLQESEVRKHEETETIPGTETTTSKILSLYIFFSGAFRLLAQQKNMVVFQEENKIPSLDP